MGKKLGKPPSKAEALVLIDFAGQKIEVLREYVTYPQSYIWELEMILDSSGTRNLNLLGSFHVDWLYRCFSMWVHLTFLLEGTVHRDSYFAKNICKCELYLILMKAL